MLRFMSLLAVLSFWLWPRMIRARQYYRSLSMGVLLAGAASMLVGQTVHPLAQPRYDQGPVEATLRLGHIQIMFQQTAAQREDLDELLAAQRDPSSPEYHNWLTTEQYADRFGLSVTDLDESRGCSLWRVIWKT